MNKKRYIAPVTERIMMPTESLMQECSWVVRDGREKSLPTSEKIFEGDLDDDEEIAAKRNFNLWDDDEE